MPTNAKTANKAKKPVKSSPRPSIVWHGIDDIKSWASKRTDNLLKIARKCQISDDQLFIQAGAGLRILSDSCADHGDTSGSLFWAQLAILLENKKSKEAK